MAQYSTWFAVNWNIDKSDETYVEYLRSTRDVSIKNSY